MVFVFSGAPVDWQRALPKGTRNRSFVLENNKLSTTGLYMGLLLKPNWTVYFSSNERVISFVGIYQCCTVFNIY